MRKPCPEVSKLASRIDEWRLEFDKPQRGGGRPPLWRTAIKATRTREWEDSHALARYIARCLLRDEPRMTERGRIKKDQRLSTFTVAQRLTRDLSLGSPMVGVWFVWLAYDAGLIQSSFLRPIDTRGASVTGRIELAKGVNLDALFAELVPDDAVQTARPIIVPWDQLVASIDAGNELPESVPSIRRNRKSKQTDSKSELSEPAYNAAQAVHATPWRVNPYMLREIGKIGLDKLDLPADARRVWAQAQHRAKHAPDGFYIPVSFDFRGRLNQTGQVLQWTGGSDFTRGLLEFANGMRWDALHEDQRVIAEQRLKMYVASCYGERGTDDERLAFVDEKQTTIRLSVANPGKHDFWLGAKEPFRFLAAAHALFDADELHIPVAIDATSSGLQHYACLLRDESLARQVNLGPGDEPEDFYEGVAELCQLDLGDVISRKTVKDVAVPMLYGNTLDLRVGAEPTFFVPKYGERAVIEEHILRRMPGVAKLLFWFVGVANAATAANKGLSWTTPSGFHVTQFNREQDRKLHEITLPEFGTRTLTERFPSDRFDWKKQSLGLAANFVHSMDAALLHLLIDAGRTSQPDWAVAHDSFAVPAWRVADLERLVGPTMYKMYTPDVLRAVWVEWRKELSPALRKTLPALPGKRRELTAVRGISGNNPHVLRS